MPSSAVHSFTDPDEYAASIQRDNDRSDGSGERPIMQPTTLAFSAATFLVIACVPAGAQQTTGTPRCAERHDDNRRQLSSASAPAVRRHDQPGRQKFQTVLATDRGAAQRCAQRLADHDR